MKISQGVFDLAESFMQDAQYVKINHDKIKKFAETMKQTVPRKFAPPKPPPSKILEILTQLLAGSINYCYWYGRHDIRPNGSSSGRMYEIVEQNIKDGRGFLEDDITHLDRVVNTIVMDLAEDRFPLLEERQKHLKEVVHIGFEFAKMVEAQTRNSDHDSPEHLNYLLRLLILNFPGYASDIFLKRASLFFLMLYRRFGWFEKSLRLMHVPADYQVPKLMHFFDLLEYNDELSYEIENNILIPKHSVKECEIRSATILACKELCDLTEWNVAEVDGWFWLRRKECNNPFHLTITSDY
jgi:hypothetical protein